jgi:GxxExxY protein
VTENQIAAIVIEVAFRIHRQYGPGMFESAYKAVMVYELAKRGLRVASEVLVPLVHDGLRLEPAFRIDLLVDDLVIVELKSVEAIAPVHKMQVLTYLRITRKRLGLLINFGAPRLKEGLHRIVNSLPE